MKKATGIVRNVDSLGRVCLPKELRGTLKIANGDPIEIFVTANEIVLRKYQPAGGCSLCGSTADRYAEMGQHRICPVCAQEIVERLG